VRVIGVDPSLSGTGICDVAGQMSCIGGDAKLGNDRLRLIYDAVLEAAVHADHAIVEDLPTHAMGAGKTGMAQGVVRLALVSLRVPFTLVAPATLKKFATGRGDADKKQMRAALLERTGMDVRNDNKVDAWWLRAMGLQRAGQLPFILPAAHLGTLQKVEWAA
jgi:Holliday junction resolvasome RuvABC endonuclease subunit